MSASTALLKSLRWQGLHVGVKKGSEARKSKGNAKNLSSGDEEEDDSGISEDGGRIGSNRTEDTGSTDPLSPNKKKGKK